MEELLTKLNQTPQSNRTLSTKRMNDETKLKIHKQELSNQETLMRKVASEIEKKGSYKRPNRNIYLIEDNFKQMREKFSAKFEQNRYVFQSNYITTVRHSSLESDLNKLKPITFKDMMVNKIHLGTYIKCNSIAKPFYVSGMHLLVQDAKGDYENLVLHNFESKSCDLDPQILIPLGTQLIIKEPHLQMFGLNPEQDFGIRVDSPTDVMIQVSLNSTEANKTAEQLIEEGNKAFLAHKFHQAIHLYSNAIFKSNKKSHRAFLNRSQCFIKLEKFNAAYQDANEATKLDTQNEKAYFRMGKSAYALRKFELALQNYEQCLKLNSKNQEAQNELVRTKERLNESKTGTFNFKALYEQFFKREDLFMDIADYKSDKITVAEIHNKAKGVIATDHIPKGTLLIVSKAASAVFHTKSDYRVKGYTKIDFYDGSYNTRQESENITNLAYKMQDDPELAEKIYSLFGGPEFNRDPLPHPLIDMKRIEAIHEFNSFQIQNSLESLQVIELNKQLKAFKNYNEADFRDFDLTNVGFESNEQDYVSLARLQVKINNLDKQCGLWFMPAHLNHSCISNSIMDFIGDVMTIYALRDIKKNEEVTIRYFPPELAYVQRDEYAVNKYKFKCDCQLCDLDRKDSMRTVRDELFYKIITKNSNQQIILNELVADVNKMRTTFANRSKFQLQLITPLDILAKKYRNTCDYKKSAKCFEEIFELTKDNNDFIALAVLKEASNDYKNSSQMKKSEKCKEKALNYFIQIYSQKPIFEQIWEKIFFNGFNFVF